MSISNRHKFHANKNVDFKSTLSSTRTKMSISNRLFQRSEVYAKCRFQIDIKFHANKNVDLKSTFRISFPGKFDMTLITNPSTPHVSTTVTSVWCLVSVSSISCSTNVTTVTCIPYLRHHRHLLPTPSSPPPPPSSYK